MQQEHQRMEQIMDQSQDYKHLQVQPLEQLLLTQRMIVFMKVVKQRLFLYQAFQVQMQQRSGSQSVTISNH